jgi:hypothetical protein
VHLSSLNDGDEMEATMQGSVSKEISEYLNSVKSHLSHLSPGERQAVLDNLELQITDTLKQRLGAESPTLDDVRAVISEMDPPENFGRNDELRYGSRMRLLRKLMVTAAVMFGVGLLLTFVSAFLRIGNRQLYIGRVKVTERLSQDKGIRVYGNVSGAGPKSEFLSLIRTSSYRSKIAKRAAETLRAFGVSVTQESLLESMKIEQVPDSQILMVEVISSDRDEAETEADALATEMQKAYREEALGGKKPGQDAAALKIIEEAHVYPVNMHRMFVGIVGAVGGASTYLSFLLVLIAGVGYLWTRIQAGAEG